MDFFTLILIFLVILLLFSSFYIGRALGKRYMFEVMQHVMEKEKKKAVDKSRSVVKGQFSEQLSPFAPDFPGKPSEARFLGAPIDFIIFNGLDEKEVSEIILVDIKTGNSQLNKTQKSIKQAIENKQIRFEEYRL